MTTTWKLTNVTTSDRATVYQAINADALRLKDGYASLYSACQAAYPVAFDDVNGVLRKCKVNADAQLAASNFICNLAVGAVLSMVVGPFAGKLAATAMGVVGVTDFAKDGTKKIGAAVGSWAIKEAMPKADLSPFSVGQNPLQFISSMQNKLANFQQRIDAQVSSRDGAGGTQAKAADPGDDTALGLKKALQEVQKDWPDLPIAPDGTETWTSEHLESTLKRSLWLAWIMARDTSWWLERARRRYGDGKRHYHPGAPPKADWDQFRLSSSDEEEWLFRPAVNALSVLSLPGKYYRLELFWAEKRKIGWPTPSQDQETETVYVKEREWGLNVANLILWANPKLPYAKDWLASGLKGASIGGSDILEALAQEVSARPRVKRA
jgi:hypothetical protein